MPVDNEWGSSDDQWDDVDSSDDDNRVVVNTEKNTEIIRLKREGAEDIIKYDEERRKCRQSIFDLKVKVKRANKTLDHASRQIRALQTLIQRDVSDIELSENRRILLEQHYADEEEAVSTINRYEQGIRVMQMRLRTLDHEYATRVSYRNNTVLRTKQYLEFLAKQRRAAEKQKTSVTYQLHLPGGRKMTQVLYGHPSNYYDYLSTVVRYHIGHSDFHMQVHTSYSRQTLSVFDTMPSNRASIFVVRDDE